MKLNLTEDCFKLINDNDIMLPSFTVSNNTDGSTNTLFCTTNSFDRIHVYSRSFDYKVDGEQVEIIFDIQQMENKIQFLKYEMRKKYSYE